MVLLCEGLKDRNGLRANVKFPCGGAKFQPKCENATREMASSSQNADAPGRAPSHQNAEPCTPECDSRQECEEASRNINKELRRLQEQWLLYCKDTQQ